MARKHVRAVGLEHEQRRNAIMNARKPMASCCDAHSTSDMGHFETKSDAYRCASICLILLQELTLTFWCSASKVGA
jgi:hypothetical protein